MVDRRCYRIFLSSPGDVMAERNCAQAVIERLNAQHPGAPLFSLTRWEQSYYSATGPFQDQIASPGDHDIVVFIFWKRLGTDLPPRYNRKDGTSRTGTEYEFEEARDARERRDDQLPDILVYRKTAKVLFSEEDLDIERAQKKALDQFWERWFRTDTGHLIAGFQSVVDPADFEQQLEHNLREWLIRRHAGQVVWNVAQRGSPYRGLVPFEDAHAALFFGRDVDMGRARARFIEAAIGQESGRRGTPFLLILGASGCGKSSFLRAGLLPRMRAAGAPAFLEDGSDGIHAFRSLILTPREMGENLCLGFARAIYRLGASEGRHDVGLPELADGDYASAEDFAALAAISPSSAASPIIRALDRVAIESSVAGDAPGPVRRFGLLVAIDQMEELFARQDADRTTFVALVAALANTGRVWVVATMRNDFYDRLRQDAELSVLSDRGRLYDLAPPGVADYREIIRQPALAAGLRFEATARRDLAAEIEAEAGGEGALPMIAFLLEQLFQERRGNLLTLETYDRLGGAAGALAQQGDHVIASLPERVQAVFPRVVRRLVRKSLQDLVPTATSAPLSAFSAGTHERQLIDALSSARLLRMFAVEPSGTASAMVWIRFAHEALLTRWPRLRNSIDADRRDYETLDRLQNAYSLWEDTPPVQRSGRLLADLALAESVDLVQRWESDVDEPLRQFADASHAHAQARRPRRRRNVSIIVASLSVLAILASIASVAAYLQRNRALIEQAAADRTTDFMVHLFKVADPGENRGTTMTVREMLDRGASEVSTGLESEPAVRADLRTAMGQAYAGLGLYGSAEKLLEDAQRDETAGAIAPESRVRTLVALGSTLYLNADYVKAAEVLHQAVSVARAKLPVESVLRSDALVALANEYDQDEKYDEAEQLCREALVADRKRAEEHPDRLARTLDSLGSIYLDRGDLKDAEKTMREALDLHVKTAGLRDAMTAQAMNNLAAVLYLSGRYDENVSLLEKALPIYEEVYGRDHPEVAVILNNMGRSALMAGRINEAVPMLQRAIELNEKLKGPTHDDLVAPLNSLAMIDAFKGHLADAQVKIQRAEQIARLPNHGKMLDQVLLNAADIELRDGDADRTPTDLAESRRLLETAFPLATHPSEAWRYAVWDTVNAEWLARTGDALEARRAIDSALPVITARFGRNGFYLVLAEQRSQFVEDQRRRGIKAR
jgi:tetratricopeptide (TPR) repeat protein